MEDDAVGIIHNENWIAGLSDEVRTAIEARMTRVAIAAGGAVKRAGEAATRVFQVESGFLSLVGLHADGRQALITIYAPGNCFSETAVVSRRRHNHTTIALTPAVVRQLESDDFWELYHRHPEIPEALCRKFAGAISRQMASREQRATQRLGRRIAWMFTNLADHAGHPKGDGTAVALSLTQTNIADLFDVTRQSVHREISRLRELRLIDKQDGVWMVFDLDRLRALAMRD